MARRRQARRGADAGCRRQVIQQRHCSISGCREEGRSVSINAAGRFARRSATARRHAAQRFDQAIGSGDAPKLLAGLAALGAEEHLASRRLPTEARPAGGVGSGVVSAWPWAWQWQWRRWGWRWPKAQQAGRSGRGRISCGRWGRRKRQQGQRHKRQECQRRPKTPV